jgi:hypothetical protein
MHVSTTILVIFMSVSYIKNKLAFKMPFYFWTDISFFRKKNTYKLTVGFTVVTMYYDIIKF